MAIRERLKKQKKQKQITKQINRDRRKSLQNRGNMPKREMSKGKKDCRFLKPASRTNHFIGTVYKCSKCMPSVRPRSALSKSSNMSFSKERRILEEGRI